MKNKSISTLLNYLRNTKNQVFDAYSKKTYSQEGEDMVLDRLLNGKLKGFYVDVGAHHPHRFSNTNFFYKRGWHGINIDAMPGSMKLFYKYRKRDINLEIGIGKEDCYADYYIFNDLALNGFSKELSDLRDQDSTAYVVIEVKKISIKPLRYILSHFLPEHQSIDFMTIDVEGLDLDVLSSNDWDIFRPKYILVEILGDEFMEIINHPIYIFMLSKDYRLIAKTRYTVFFQNNFLI